MAQNDTGRLTHFPAFVRVEACKIAVFGNGAEAFAKARLLSNTDAAIHAYAAAPQPDYAAWLAGEGICHIGEAYEPGQLEGAVLAFAATDDAEADARIVVDARTRRIPVNAVDQPGLCDFYTPALVNRAPIAVAIGTEGAGPVLAQMIRARVDQLLSPSLGTLARFAAGYRAAVDRLAPAGPARRDLWRRFFTGAVAQAIASGDEALARRAAARLLGESGERTCGHVWLIGAGPGAEDLLTLRAQRALMEADIILRERSVPRAIADLGRRDAERMTVEVPGTALSRAIDASRTGRRVALLFPGDPSADPDFTRSLDAAGLSFEIVPGVAGAHDAILPASQAA